MTEIVHKSWCEMSSPNPPEGFRSRICTCVPVQREEMDSTWCVHCCHSHPSGEMCGAEYIYVPEIGRDFCGCNADHHPVAK